MTVLNVSQSDPTWGLIERFLLARIEALKEEAVNLNADPADRERAAVRISEIRVLLNAPKEALAIGLGSAQPQGGSY